MCVCADSLMGTRVCVCVLHSISAHRDPVLRLHMNHLILRSLSLHTHNHSLQLRLPLPAAASLKSPRYVDASRSHSWTHAVASQLQSWVGMLKDVRDQNTAFATC